MSQNKTQTLQYFKLQKITTKISECFEGKEIKVRNQNVVTNTLKFLECQNIKTQKLECQNIRTQKSESRYTPMTILRT